MNASCQNVKVHHATPVLRVQKTGNPWYLHTEANREGLYDHVVISV